MVQKVYSELDSMTKTERQTAECFLEHPDDFTFLTLDKIAQKVPTSTASVIRFCRRLGYFGFKDFQDALRESLSTQMTLPLRLRHNRQTQSDRLLDRVISDGIQAIHRTFSDLSPEHLAAAVDLLEDGRRVFTFGLRESYALAHYAYTRLITVRSSVQILDTGFQTMLEPLLDLNAEDVCICFLFHRYTEQSLRILPMLKATGASIILITSEPCEPQVAVCSDICLPCHVENNGIKNTYLAPITLMDYLCNALGQAEAADDRLDRIEALLQSAEVLGS